MQRTLARRIIWDSGAEVFTTPHVVDLALVAHAAAIETLQIDIVANGWVGLFGALLEPGDDDSELVWRENGPGGEAEIKRAYSALFGRFFGRAILRHEHGCVDLRQVRDPLEIASGLQLRRRPVVSARGDLPDWIGWNTVSNSYSVCEAKGSYEQADWETRRPPVVTAALEQANRMEIVDAAGIRVQTKNWVVASRWGTASNGRTPTVITLDPPTEGRRLSEDEAAKAQRETHALFIADLLKGLGRADLAREGRALASARDAGAARDMVALAEREGYAAILVDGAGLFPLKGGQRRRRFDVLREAAEDAGRKIAVVLLESDAVQAAADRSPRPQDRELVRSDNGLTITSDGVTLTWDLDVLDFGAAA